MTYQIDIEELIQAQQEAIETGYPIPYGDGDLYRALLAIAQQLKRLADAHSK